MRGRAKPDGGPPARQALSRPLRLTAARADQLREPEFPALFGSGILSEAASVPRGPSRLC